jgi:hypothetical protein
LCLFISIISNILETCGNIEVALWFAKTFLSPCYHYGITLARVMWSEENPYWNDVLHM